MANTIKSKDLDAAIAQELTLYHRDVLDKVNSASEKAVKALVKKTKASAPIGARGDFKRHISSKLLKTSRIGGKTFVWYVKAPDHRLTHLLVNGHATKDGGRTKANPFLYNAWNSVRQEYEKDVEEAVKNG